VIVVCRQRYSSSPAAAGLRAVGLHRATDLTGGVAAWLAVGLHRATDLAGGVAAWLAAGLPVGDGPADVRE
jgi:rhodanese-related sulfurtransferase